jgi:hypothetical protein
MAWDEDVESGRKFEEELRAFFDKQCIYYAMSGHERLEKAYLAFLDGQDDSTARLVRHFPDFVVVLSAQTWLLDAKSGKAISKKSYDVCRELAAHGYRVGIIVGPTDSPRFVHIQDLIFMALVNGEPTCDGVWVVPSKLDPSELKERERKGLGTEPFAYIDYGATPFKKILDLPTVWDRPKGKNK